MFIFITVLNLLLRVAFFHTTSFHLMRWKLSGIINKNTIGTLSSLIQPESFGSDAYKETYGVKYAYHSGGMYRGIASKELVIRMGQSGLMGFFGAAGLPINEIERNIDAIQLALTSKKAFGINLIHHFDSPEMELRLVDLFLNKGITCVEAAAFMGITPALILYRLKGLSDEGSGCVQIKNRLIAKVSRPETAEQFMSPAPEQLVQLLRAKGRITETEARLGAQVPMC